MSWRSLAAGLQAENTNTLLVTAKVNFKSRKGEPEAGACPSLGQAVLLENS